MHSEAVEDASPGARGPRRAISSEMIGRVDPSALGPRRLNPRWSHDRTAAARQSEDDFECSWWLRVLICRLGDEMGRSGGQHPFELCQKLVVGEARFTASRALNGRGRGA